LRKSQPILPRGQINARLICQQVGGQIDAAQGAKGRTLGRTQLVDRPVAELRLVASLDQEPIDRARQQVLCGLGGGGVRGDFWCLQPWLMFQMIDDELVRSL